MTPRHALLGLVGWRALTYWEWEPSTIMPLGYGGGTVLKCSICRCKVHAHAQDCPLPRLGRLVAAAEAVAACYAPLNVEECPDQDLSGACIRLTDVLAGGG